jgi:hypothetical protein
MNAQSSSALWGASLARSLRDRHCETRVPAAKVPEGVAATDPDLVVKLRPDNAHSRCHMPVLPVVPPARPPTALPRCC